MVQGILLDPIQQVLCRKIFIFLAQMDSFLAIAAVGIFGNVSR